MATVRVSILVVMVIGVIGVLAVFPVQVCRDWAFVCECTGSQKGYRQWCIGLRTGQWYQATHLEQFMEARHPALLSHDWVSYRGTVRNVFGRAILSAHGHPRNFVMLYRAALDRYVDTLDDAGKLSLYSALVSGPPSEVEAHMRRMMQEH